MQLDPGISPVGENLPNRVHCGDSYFLLRHPQLGMAGDKGYYFAKTSEVPMLINPNVFWGQDSSLRCTHPVPLHTGQGLQPVLQYKCPFTIIKAWDCKTVLENKSGRRIHLCTRMAAGRPRQSYCLALSLPTSPWQC